ncbi:MAG: hypothetical protein K2X35_04700 [Bryobacteraceae bacterium]|nr:hypothetical protein [Bryobacteraceae bacterium]
MLEAAEVMNVSSSPAGVAVSRKQTARWRSVAGYGILAISILFYTLSLVAPFVPVSAGERAGLFAGALLTGKACFWTGVVVAGPDLLTRLRGLVRSAKSLILRTPAAS